jgi:transcriptional regulator with XRE-family HTH domain
VTLGQRVERIRATAPEHERLSRPDLARRLGLDRSAVTHWALGNSSPRDIEAVASVLGVTVAEIYAGRRDRKRRAA